MEDALIQRLVDEVKNNLNIDWEYEGTNKQVTNWTKSGVSYLNRLAGESMDYLVESAEWSLLMEFVRYARDGALDVFEGNYLNLILAMQNEKRLKREHNDN